jgi:hypothetical protein
VTCQPNRKRYAGTFGGAAQMAQAANVGAGTKASDKFADVRIPRPIPDEIIHWGRPYLSQPSAAQTTRDAEPFDRHAGWGANHNALPTVTEPVGETTAGANYLTFSGSTDEYNKPVMQSNIDTYTEVSIRVRISIVY